MTDTIRARADARAGGLCTSRKTRGPARVRQRRGAIVRRVPINGPSGSVRVIAAEIAATLSPAPGHRSGDRRGVPTTLCA